MGEVERKDILALQYELRDKPTVANRAVDMLVKMFNQSIHFDFCRLRPNNNTTYQ